MAPILDASTPARVTSAGSVASVTSASFNPPANCTLIAIPAADIAAGNSATLTISNNGAATTWNTVAIRDEQDSGGEPGEVAAFVTTLTASRTGMTVTASLSISNEISLRVYVFTAVDLSDPIGAVIEGSSTSNAFTTTNLTSENSDSVGIVAANDALGNQTANPTSSDTTFSAYFVSGQIAGGSGYKTLGNAGSTATFNVDGSGSVVVEWNWIAFELKSAVTVHTGAVSLSSTSTLTVGGTVIPVQQGAVSLTVNKTLIANAGQQGNVSLTVNKTLTVQGQVTLQQLAISLSSTSTLTIGQVQQTHAVLATLIAVVTLQASGSRSRAAILETRYERPPAEHPFRVIVQEILTGEIVEWDLPVSEEFTYTRQLTGPTIMEGEFKPEIISVQELGLDGFAYWLHVEIDDQIRASAILLPPRYEGSSLKFSAEGVAAAPHYTTWTTTLSSTNIDPFVVVRNIWNHVQADPRSAYGVVVSNNLSGRRLGEDAKTVTEMDSENQPVVREIDAEPYELMWWEGPNCGDQIDTLASQVPFDYKERVTWNSTKTDVLHYIDLAYPRMGSPKPDLAFNEENILEVVPVQEPEDTYASEVIVIGAGEGSAAIRGYAAENFSNRVRKSYVVTNKTITTKARADAVAKSELGLRRGRLFEISEIVIRAVHANASIGEYDLGDDIYVEVDIPWMLTIYGAWYRIIAINHQPSYDYLRLTLERSDSFRYPVV